MPTVTGLTAARMLEIEAASIVDGDVVGDNLILTKFNGVQINAGNVRGPISPQFDLGNVINKTSAEIDALFASTPPNGTLATGIIGTDPAFFMRRAGKWHAAGMIQIA